MNLLQRLNAYQKRKFPLRILVFTTLLSVLSSAAVINYTISFQQGLLVFISVMLFLFHIRVLDESRDFSDDEVFTPDSPVHNGTISLKQLLIADGAGLSILIGISLSFAWPARWLLLALFLFTTLTWKDFFLRKAIRKSKVIYHLVNSPQMVLLQLFIFAAFTDSLMIDINMWLLLLLVYNNIFVLEVARKISTDTNKKDFNDTYNSRMGLSGALLFTYLLSIIGVGLTLGLAFLLSGRIWIYGLILIPFLIVHSFSSIKFAQSAQSRYSKLFLLSVFLEYIAMNGIICLAAL